MAPYGKEQTWAIKSKLMGTPERKATEILLSSLWPPAEGEPGPFSHDCPFTIDSFLSHRNMNLDDYFSKVKPMPGAEKVVKHLADCGVPICVATGSKRRNFDIKSGANPSLFAPFGTRVVCGDDERIKRGKPNPDIFLLAAREGLQSDVFKTGIRELGEEHDGELAGREGEILVFEDAKPGVQAAKRAGMNVVWVPDPNLKALLKESDEDIGATQTIDSLLDWKPEQWGLPPYK